MNGQLSSLIQIDVPNSIHFNLKSTALSHGWVYLDPFRWDNSTNHLHLILSDNKSAYPGYIFQKNNTIIFVSKETVSLQKKEIIKSLLKRVLSLQQDLTDFQTLCKVNRNSKFIKLIQLGWGRLLRGSSSWEDASKTLMTTNASWGHTVKMCSNLCRMFGNTGAFPAPREIVAKGKKYLRQKTKLGYRSDYLYRLAVMIEEGLNLDNYEKGKCDRAHAEKTVYALKGFGPYAANHLLVLLGWYEYLPVDREVMKYLGIKSTNGRCPANIKNFSEWGEYKFLAYKLQRIARRQNWIGD